MTMSQLSVLVIQKKQMYSMHSAYVIANLVYSIYKCDTWNNGNYAWLFRDKVYLKFNIAK